MEILFDIEIKQRIDHPKYLFEQNLQLCVGITMD